jgi:flagellar hook-basal body complex protein FliE
MAFPLLPVNLNAPPAIAPIAPPPAPAPITTGAPTGGEAFQQVFSEAIAKVENFGNIATKSVENFLSGEGEELHTMAIKSQQAELSFDLFLQVRNKIVSAYQEVMRMQV